MYLYNYSFLIAIQGCDVVESDNPLPSQIEVRASDPGCGTPSDPCVNSLAVILTIDLAIKIKMTQSAVRKGQ